MHWKTNQKRRLTFISRQYIFLAIITASNIVPNAIVARLLSIECGPYETVFDEVNCKCIKSQTRSLYIEHIGIIQHTFISFIFVSLWHFNTLMVVNASLKGIEKTILGV